CSSDGFLTGSGLPAEGIRRRRDACATLDRMSEHRRLKFGIVGAGAISSAHIRALSGLSHKAGLVAVAGIRRAAAEAATSNSGAKPYRSLDEMLQGADLDVVNICTPPNVHADQAVAAMRAGKDVIVEKPADVNVEATDRIIAAAKETGRKATIVSQ